jgi:thiamine-phosphate pyrophosphorylase
VFLPNSSRPGSDSALGSALNSMSEERHILCYVTDRCSLAPNSGRSPRESLLSTIAAAATAGVDWIQLREKDLPGKECAELTRAAILRLANLSVPRGSVLNLPRVIVNDRLDVALAERADGVHLRENSLPPGEAKRLVRLSAASRLVPKGFLVGVSCHSLEAAQSAATAGADYIFLGPVFLTPSKAAFGAPLGLSRLAEVCRSVSIPVLAIGGINLANVALCFAAGAAGVAAIRFFQEASDLPRLIQVLRESSR